MRVLVTMMALIALPALAAGEEPLPPNPFFALCMDTHDAKKRTVEQQAAMLEELGYAGCAHLWLKGVPERLKTLDARGLQLFQIYVRVNVAKGKQPYDPQLNEVVKLLEGRRTTLGLLVGGAKPSAAEADERGVAVLREIADMAAEQGLRVAIYPHTGDWTETVEDALRVAKKVDRPNLGVMFNLCHWLKTGGEAKGLEPVLRDAMASADAAAGTSTSSRSTAAASTSTGSCAPSASSTTMAPSASSATACAATPATTSPARPPPGASS